MLAGCSFQINSVWDIATGKECSRGKDCKFSHDLTHFDEHGNPKRKSQVSASTVVGMDNTAAPLAASIRGPCAFGTLWPKVVVGVSRSKPRKGGRSRRGLPAMREAAPPSGKVQQLLEKFDTERRAAVQQWHARMAEKEVYAMKRARAM